MKKRVILTMALMFLLIIPVSGYGEKYLDIVEKSTEGTINWSKGVVQANGLGIPSKKIDNNSQRRLKALADAKLDAFSKILEVVQGVRIDGTTCVGDFADKNDIVMSKIETMARSAKMVKEECLSNGNVKITMEMNLRDGFSQLVLPEAIRALESIQVAKKMKNSSTGFTGLVVDARGLDVKPVMSLKIFDENDQEVYGPAFVSREYAVQQGVVEYTGDITEAQKNKRVAGNPLTVKGLRTAGKGRSDIVISNLDASKLISASENIRFMKQCRVVIVVDF
jgi:hypothetical protein